MLPPRIPNHVLFENNMYAQINAYLPSQLTLCGGSNSRVGDIRMGSGNKFIEIKMPHCHFGQIVLRPDMERRCYNVSESSYYKPGKFVLSLVSHLNNNFEGVSYTRKIPDEWEDDVLIPAITEMLLDKGFLYILTKGSDDRPCLFPTHEIGNYFTIRGIIRAKLSGSRKIPKRMLQDVRSVFKTLYPHAEMRDDGSLVNTHEEDAGAFVVMGKNVMIRNAGHENACARIQGRTRNLNLMFSGELKRTQNEREFHRALAQIREMVD